VTCLKGIESLSAFVALLAEVVARRIMAPVREF